MTYLFRIYIVYCLLFTETWIRCSVFAASALFKAFFSNMRFQALKKLKKYLQTKNQSRSISSIIDLWKIQFFLNLQGTCPENEPESSTEHERSNNFSNTNGVTKSPTAPVEKQQQQKTFKTKICVTFLFDHTIQNSNLIFKNGSCKRQKKSQLIGT